MHSHDHESAATIDFGRAFKVGITLNVVFVIVEFASGLAFRSVSLLADAGHNLSDVFGLLLAFVAFRLASVKPSRRFTYGLGSSTILASTINGAILLVAVGAISWEAIGRFYSPSKVHGVGMIVVALIGVVINSVTACLFFRGRSHDLNVKGAFLHMLADAVVSLGVVIAGILILLTKLMWIDPVISLVISVVILYSTWGLLRDSLLLLAQGVPSNIDLDEIRQYFRELPGVAAVHDLHVWALSTTKTALTVHLVRPEIQSSDELLSKISQEIHTRFGIDHSTVQIETNSDKWGCKLVSDDEI